MSTTNGRGAPTDADAWAPERERMVRTQLEARGIRDPRVLGAMRAVPRHLFVPPHLAEYAYDDGPLPIGRAQTISQPFVVALMTELALPPGARRALDVGTGSGYQAAVLSRVVPEVFGVERIPELLEQARARLERLGCSNVRLRCSDGHEGWPEAAPFDAILVACAADEVPSALIEQLATGGRLVLPVGTRAQHLVRIEKLPNGEILRSSAGGVAFVPMVRGSGPRED